MSLLKNADIEINRLKKMDFKIFIITSGFSLITDTIAAKLRIDDCIANLLECENGMLTGNVDMIVTDINKSEHIKNICVKNEIFIENCIAIGDSKYDLEIFDEVRYSIALNPNDSIIKDKAKTTIYSDDLMDIIPQIDEWSSESIFI